MSSDRRIHSTKESAVQIKILALCGSSRRDSLNQQLLDIASLGAVDAGAQVSLIRWLDFPLPIYDGDWEDEHGLPERARALKALLAQHHALLIATPEYNGGYTALLKNALDWASRPSESDPTGLEVFAGKVAAVVSASPGVLGGMRAQIALQISLNKLGMLVIPNSFALSLAHQAFDEQRRLKDGNVDQNVRGVGAALVRTAIALAPTPKRSEFGDWGGADSGALAARIEQLIVGMVRENPGWGYDRIVGALANLGHAVSNQTVGNVLRRMKKRA
jgi:NAD(P)H-dependent FMN reductase